MRELLPVGPFQETLGAGMCGPASLKVVLSYYGVEKSEAELAVLCGTDRELGTTAEDLRRVAEELGFEAEVKNGSSFEDIGRWLSEGVPAIVDWFSRGRSDASDSAVADGHYSVVVGLDDRDIFLQDPETGSLRRMDREDFLTVWFDFTGKHISLDGLIIRQAIAIRKN
jgi:predicted double-glycine peptidase